MKKSRFSESQIVNILKEAEAGVALEDLSRQHGFSKATFYKISPICGLPAPLNLAGSRRHYGPPIMVVFLFIRGRRHRPCWASPTARLNKSRLPSALRGGTNKDPQICLSLTFGQEFGQKEAFEAG